MKPHSVAVHPSPTLQRRGRLAQPGRRRRCGSRRRCTHAHPECGNGVTWSLELRRGATRQRLAAGVAQGGKRRDSSARSRTSPCSRATWCRWSIGPRDGNHSCDLTDVDLDAHERRRRAQEWNLARDVSADVLAGNPHADRFGNEDVWHFYTEPDQGGDDAAR